ncbi:TPA: Ig-like domain-containing protein [Vibrio parahaemolyticus]
MTCLLGQHAFAASHVDNQFAVDDQYTVHTAESQVFDVLANDIGENLIIESALSGYGEFAVTDNKVLFTPSASVLAEDSPQAKFGYTVVNGEGLRETGIAVVNYDLSAGNHAPVAMDDHLYAVKNKSVFADVLKNDYDPDEGDTLSVAEAFSYDALVELQDDGQLRVDRISNKTPIEVIYNVIDSDHDHDYGMLTIDYVEDEDVLLAKDDLYLDQVPSEVLTFDVLANDVFSNEQTQITRIVSKLDVITIDRDYLVFTPTSDFDYSEPYRFAYTITANGHSDDAIVTLSFNQNVVNHAPVLQEDTVYAERLGSVRIRPLANDTDQDNDPLTLTAAFSESGNTEIDGEEIIFTPNADFDEQNAQILYEASDGRFDGKARQIITIHYADGSKLCE